MTSVCDVATALALATAGDPEVEEEGSMSLEYEILSFQIRIVRYNSLFCYSNYIYQ